LLGSEFLGVFSLDQIPILRPGGFIVNTQTHELPGEHWIAVYITQSEIYVYDPFGFYYPSLLVKKLTEMNRRIVYNRSRDQDPFSNSCGQHCLLWLEKISGINK